MSNETNRITIEHCGKLFTVNADNMYHFDSKEDYENLVRQYYEHPDITEADIDKELYNIGHGGVAMHKTVVWYFRDLQAKVKIYNNRFTIEEALSNQQIVEYLLRYVGKNLKVYPPNTSLERCLETALRISALGIASKPANFPVQTVISTLQKYNVNGRYYDFSCGWGNRLVGALRENVEYYGTDPNYLLVERLNDLSERFQRVNHCERVVDIRCTGSEEFHKDWENKMGLAFSSPPYFNLEDYRVGKQSYTDGMTYEDWKYGFMDTTVKNIYRYLVDGGYMILNIKDFNKLPLVKDMTEIIEGNGLKYIGKELLTGRSKRVTNLNTKDGTNKVIDNTEYLYVFQKTV